MAKDRLTWLCRDEHARERLLDMDRRLKGARTAAMSVLGVALLVVAPWEGWWTLIVLAITFGGFAVTAPLAPRVAHPELLVAAAWIASGIAIALAIALTGGPQSPAVSWLAIPAVTLAARFDGRGVSMGLLVLMVLLLAVTAGVDPGAVADRPAQLLLPLAMLAAVTLLTTPLMSSDLEHRSESVLDNLTGMLNRRSLAPRAAELEQQAALTGQHIGVVIGDLDHFKNVNDEHGHQTGDAVLVDVAYTLRKQLRAFDLAYRLGGEEFLVLLPGATLEDAVALAERLRVAVELTRAGGLHVTMSFGVASASGADVHHTELLAAADDALYAAKRGGRNRVEVAGDVSAPLAAA